MSYCEDYTDPFPRECDHGIPDGIRCGECAAEMEDDQEDWECAFPDRCLMPSPLHHRSECYTVADAEAYYAEVEHMSVTVVDDDIVRPCCPGRDYAVYRISRSKPGCVDFCGTVYAEDLLSAEAVARLMYPVSGGDYLEVEVDK